MSVLNLSHAGRKPAAPGPDKLLPVTAAPSAACNRPSSTSTAPVSGSQSRGSDRLTGGLGMKQPPSRAHTHSTSRVSPVHSVMIVSDVIKILQHCLVEQRSLLATDKAFLQDFASVLEALLSTANAEALGMAASLDEFYR